MLPLSYYNLVADIISNKDDSFSEYSGAANSFFNNEVQNPNLYNKHNSFPLSMVTKLAQEDQDFVHEVITNTVEKLQWNPVEIARQLKVIVIMNIIVKSPKIDNGDFFIRLILTKDWAAFGT